MVLCYSHPRKLIHKPCLAASLPERSGDLVYRNHGYKLSLSLSYPHIYASFFSIPLEAASSVQSLCHRKEGCKSELVLLLTSSVTSGNSVTLATCLSFLPLTWGY